MIYSAQELPDLKWGIYAHDRLLAIYGCQQNCLLVLKLLQTRNKTDFQTYKHPTIAIEQAA